MASILKVNDLVDNLLRHLKPPLGAFPGEHRLGVWLMKFLVGFQCLLGAIKAKFIQKFIVTATGLGLIGVIARFFRHARSSAHDGPLTGPTIKILPGLYFDHRGVPVSWLEDI